MLRSRLHKSNLNVTIICEFGELAPPDVTVDIVDAEILNEFIFLDLCKRLLETLYYYLPCTKWLFSQRGYLVIGTLNLLWIINIWLLIHFTKVWRKIVTVLDSGARFCFIRGVI